jgi:D-glycero-D-manno-heptose 1,7-bisphosphate phosphatase
MTRSGGLKSSRDRAVFLDRDGVLNDLVFYPEEGQVGSPLSARSMRVFPYAGAAVKKIRDLGFRTVLISNQPGVAKRQFSRAELARMSLKLNGELAKHGSSLDAEYYCLHHPDALFARYRKVCDCRKPKPGLLLRAARERGLDLRSSFFVGDALVDVQAGKAAGTSTILLGHPTTFLSGLMEEKGAVPDFMVPSLKEVPGLLLRLGASGGRKRVRPMKRTYKQGG